MKKTVLLLVVFSGIVFSATDSQKDLLNRLISANGYYCESIIKATQSNYDGSWTVRCSNDALYKIKKTSTFWNVEKKY